MIFLLRSSIFDPFLKNEKRTFGGSFFQNDEYKTYLLITFQVRQPNFLVSLPPTV